MSALHLKHSLWHLFLLPSLFCSPFLLFAFVVTYFFTLSPAASMHVVSEGECTEQLEAVQDSYSGCNGGNVCQSIECCDFGRAAPGCRTLIVYTQWKSTFAMRTCISVSA